MMAVSTKARSQVLQYASIYEARLHHVLFEISRHNPRVQEIGKYISLRAYDVPPSKFMSFEHDDRQIVTAYWADGKADISKIRFDDKVQAAVDLGMINESLGYDLKEIYEARNSIHIHAELKKKLKFDTDIGRLAYRRMQPFCDQLQRYVTSHAL
jgi:hypothetical protein